MIHKNFSKFYSFDIYVTFGKSLLIKLAKGFSANQVGADKRYLRYR